MKEQNRYHNPIISGFAPDPSICRKGDDYYIATSSFEWLPGVPVYHSKDLVNWELETYCLDGQSGLDFTYIQSANGIWAPSLRYSERDGLFTLCYNVMHSTNARFFDVDNYLITAPSIHGPWSDPVFLHSAGFDGSLFQDDDGRMWFLSLEWETRDGYHKPGVICLSEYDPKERRIVGYPKRIFGGATRRGCIEGPQLYKRDGWYYLMCAEGGTGYGHCVTVARSRSVWGPYEGDPAGPVLTSTPDFDEMDNDDSRKAHRYNPDVELQKAGHGSIVETPAGEVYLAYLCGRPLLPALRCTLGRECCLQKMEWSADGWLRKAGGQDNLAQIPIDLPSLPIGPKRKRSVAYRITEGVLPLDFRSPRIFPSSFATAVDDALILRGQESLSSCHRASYLARRLTGLHDSFEARMEFVSANYHEYGGICIYYDQMDYLLLLKTFDERAGREVLAVLQVENGVRREFPDATVPAPEGPVRLRLTVDGNRTRFWHGTDNRKFTAIGPVFPTDHLSDEYCKAGEFTGTTVGLFCVDSLFHRKTARFDQIAYHSGDDEQEDR